MKKLVSILLIVTMLLASVLAMIPASAAGSEPTPLATYNVNWKDLYESGTMKAQEDLTEKTDYEYYFNVSATENSIGFTPKNDSLGKDRSYFSERMVDITKILILFTPLRRRTADRAAGQELFLLTLRQETRLTRLLAMLPSSSQDSLTTTAQTMSAESRLSVSVRGIIRPKLQSLTEKLSRWKIR